MERLILKRLLEWKNSTYRKPLILKGVQQVGKIRILKGIWQFIQRKNCLYRYYGNNNEKNLHSFSRNNLHQDVTSLFVNNRLIKKNIVCES